MHSPSERIHAGRRAQENRRGAILNGPAQMFVGNGGYRAAGQALAVGKVSFVTRSYGANSPSGGVLTAVKFLATRL